MATASYKITNFKGGYNSAVESNLLGVNETNNAQNVDIAYGDLRTIKGYSQYTSAAIGAGIKRLMKLYATDGTSGEETGYIIGATDTALYYWTGSAWSSIGSGYTAGEWEYVNCQISGTNYVIVSNGYTAMKKWDGSTISALTSDTAQPYPRSMTIHSGRMWVTGDPSYPQRVFYSYVSDDGYATSDFTKWTTSTNGAGFVDMVTFDGGKCMAVVNIFDNPVIFKSNNIFKVMGDYPGEYQSVQVYSTVGSIAERSIACSADKAFFLTKEGFFYYNGVSTFPLLGNKLKDIVINETYRYLSCAVVHKNRLYCAFPEGTSATANNTIMIYDLTDGWVMFLRGIAVTDFLTFGDKLLFTNSTGYVYNLTPTSASKFNGSNHTCYYETPFTDLERKNAVKSADTLYFSASGTANGYLQVDLTFDSKTKTKQVKLSATEKVYAIPFNIEGRKFKMKFSNVSGSEFVISSPELVMEIDND